MRALDALPPSASNARAIARKFLTDALADAVASPPIRDAASYLARANAKPRHCALLLASSVEDGTPGLGSGATAATALATLVAAGHVSAACAALLAAMRASKEDWNRQAVLLAVAARWEWAGDGTPSAISKGDEAAGHVLRLAMDVMENGAKRGAERRPFALSLAAILRALARSDGAGAGAGADHDDDVAAVAAHTQSFAYLPLDELGELAREWSKKPNAAAESASLLQAVEAVTRRRRGSSRAQDVAGAASPEAIRTALRDAIAAGLASAKEGATSATLDVLAAHLEARALDAAGSGAGDDDDASTSGEEELRDLLARAVAIGGARGPPATTWGKVERVLKAAARVSPKVAVEVLAEMLLPERGGERPGKKKKRASASAAAAGSTRRAILGAGSVGAKVVACRVLSWSLDYCKANDSYSAENGGDGVAGELADELWRSVASLAPGVASALTIPPPPPITELAGGKQSAASVPAPPPSAVAYAAHASPIDAPTGDDAEALLAAFACTPLLLAWAPDEDGIPSNGGGPNQTLRLISAAARCGNADVETAARVALRRHVSALPGPALRRAVTLSLRSAESACESFTTEQEWACRLTTAAVALSEAIGRRADDLYNDAVAAPDEDQWDDDTDDDLDDEWGSSGPGESRGAESDADGASPSARPPRPNKKLGFPNSPRSPRGGAGLNLSAFDGGGRDFASNAEAVARAAAADAGPRAAAVVLLASAHKSPVVHAAAAELLAAAEDLVDQCAATTLAMHAAHEDDRDLDAVATRVGGGLLKWLSNEASVGEETLSRAVAALGGWGDDERVRGWTGNELSGATDAGVRRACRRLAAAKALEYAPPSTLGRSGGGGGGWSTPGPSVVGFEMWRGHVALLAAAARPRGRAAGGSNAVVERGYCSEEVVRRVWEKCARDAEDAGRSDAAAASDSTSHKTSSKHATAAPPASTLGVDSTAEEARRRSEVMVEALGGVAPSCVASLVETVAADVRLNAHTIESLAAGSPALALALTPAAASTLSRATAGLCLLWILARRMTSRRAATTEFDASLETIWAASGAF